MAPNYLSIFRLLTMEEMKNFSDCSSSFRQIPSGGNLINSTSTWTISGGLIREIDVPENEISCGKKRNMLKQKYSCHFLYHKSNNF